MSVGRLGRVIEGLFLLGAKDIVERAEEREEGEVCLLGGKRFTERGGEESDFFICVVFVVFVVFVVLIVCFWLWYAECWMLSVVVCCGLCARSVGRVPRGSAVEWTTSDFVVRGLSLNS